MKTQKQSGAPSAGSIGTAITAALKTAATLALTCKQVKLATEFTMRAKEYVVETKRLRDWIRSEGVRTNTCTYDVLGEICEGCRCNR